MMYIDVKVQDPWVHFQQLQYATNYVIDIAKSTCLCLLGMVVTSSPVDCHVRYTRQNYVSSIDASTRGQLAEMIKSLETRTVKRLVDFEQSFQFIIIPDPPPLIIFEGTNNFFLLSSNPFLKIINICRMMKQIKLLLRCFLRLKHVEILTEIIILNERMCHFDSFSFHRMLLTEMIICN